MGTSMLEVAGDAFVPRRPRRPRFLTSVWFWLAVTVVVAAIAYLVVTGVAADAAASCGGG